MLTRRLALKKDTLAPLTAGDLAGVGGAADNSAGTCYTCLDCIVIDINTSLLAPTDCCQGIPTFHRGAC